jgi:invasion protein IalB
MDANRVEYASMKFQSILAVSVMLASTTGLKAQTPAPAAKAATAAAPAAKAAEGSADLTSATFGDWQFRCRNAVIAAGQPAQRSCEVLQSVIMQGQAAPFAQLAFGKLSVAEPLHVTVVLPVNVTFPSTVRITVEENDKQPVELAWTRCLPGGCFASLAVKEDVLKRWRAQNDSGRFTFKTGAGQDTTVPFSFRGLARALDAFAKEG